MLRPTWNCGLGGESTAPVEPLAVARLKLPPTTHEPQTTERLSAASTLATFGPILRVVPRRQKVLQPGTGQRAGFVPLNEILVGLDIRHCRPETHGRALGHDTAPGRRETGKEGELRAISRLLALFVGPVLAQSCKLVPTGGVARPRGAVGAVCPAAPARTSRHDTEEEPRPELRSAALRPALSMTSRQVACPPPPERLPAELAPPDPLPARAG